MVSQLQQQKAVVWSVALRIGGALIKAPPFNGAAIDLRLTLECGIMAPPPVVQAGALPSSQSPTPWKSAAAGDARSSDTLHRESVQKGTLLNMPTGIFKTRQIRKNRMPKI